MLAFTAYERFAVSNAYKKDIRAEEAYFDAVQSLAN